MVVDDDHPNLALLVGEVGVLGANPRHRSINVKADRAALRARRVASTMVEAQPASIQFSTLLATVSCFYRPSPPATS